MKAKKTKNGIKILISLVITIAMIGIPAILPAEAADPNIVTHAVTPDPAECNGTVVVDAIFTDSDNDIMGVAIHFWHDSDTEPTTWQDMTLVGGTVYTFDTTGKTIGNTILNLSQAGTWHYVMNVSNGPYVGAEAYLEFGPYDFEVNGTADFAVQVNGEDPESGKTFADVLLCCETVNITANITGGCCTVTAAHVYFTALGSAAVGEKTMTQAADGTWYWQNAQDPLTSPALLGLWEFQINATCGVYDMTSDTYNFTVVQEANDPTAVVEFGDPSYTGTDPEPWHSMDGGGMATWIQCGTNITINGSDCEGIADIYYNIWNFTDGWLYNDFQPAALSPDGTFTTTIEDEYGRCDCCKHKIEYYVEDECEGNTSEVYYEFFYVDCQPPTVTKTYDPEPCIGDPNGEDYISNTTLITLTGDDGEWNIQNKSCPSGVDYINYTIDHAVNETTYTVPFVIEDSGLHVINITIYDNVGHIGYLNQTVNVCDPPTVTPTIEETPYYHENTPKYAIDSEIDFWATVIPCDTNVTIEKVNITIMPAPTSDYYLGDGNYEFEMVYDPITETWNYTFTNTSVPGEYRYRITAWDCTGQYGQSEWFYFILLPECDVDIIELVTPDPSIWHPFVPTEVEAIIRNNGLCDAQGPINVHLQIYEEVPFDLYPYLCTDLEFCHLNTFEIISYDGDPVTWTYTEKRSNSPTHSYHSQPDYLDTYEAYSMDGLILNNGSDSGIYIPEFSSDGDSTYYAYLNFSQWIEGEEFYDYGEIQVHYSTDGVTWNTDVIDSGLFDTDGKWEWAGDVEADLDGDGEDEIIGYDLSDYIGMYVKIEWIWYADGYVNREGWYIDDICINLQFGSMQPLVYQQYKYVDTLEQGEERLIKFPLDFVPKEDTWYFFEIYSDMQCCQCMDDCFGDYDGPKDNEGEFRVDPRTTYKYWDPDNGVNHSLFFGDVCDAAIIDISAPARVEMPDHDLARIPIDVTVENTGTTTQDVPVKVTAYEAFEDVTYRDDMEGDWEDSNWFDNFIYSEGDTDTWEFNDGNFYSPYNSLYYGQQTSHQYVAGGYGYIMYEVDGFDWDYHRNAGPGDAFDIRGKLNANLGDDDMLTVALKVGNMFYRMVSAELWEGGDTNGWIDFSFYDELQKYIESSGRPEINGGNIIDLIEWYAIDDGLGGLGDWFGVGFCVQGDDYYSTYGGAVGDWSGVFVDDMEIYIAGKGTDEIWSQTLVVEDMEQGDIETLEYWWNTSLYCNYVLEATVELECDEDEENNAMETPIRIYEQIYEDGYETNDTNDNTVGLDDDWHIIEECSACPNDHFWWNGIIDDDGIAAYQPNADDVLRMLPYEAEDEDEDDEPDNDAYIDVENETFDFTADGTYTLTFDTIADIEYGYLNGVSWDYGVIEVSNDAGHNWYPIETIYEIFTWTTVSYELYNTAGTGILDTVHAYERAGHDAFSYKLFTAPAVPRTDEMMFRFHLLTDASGEWKGWMIDDVELAHDGYAFFFDDMEDGDAKWIHMKEPAGDIWHEEADYWINADAYDSWYNGHLEECYWGPYWNDVIYDEATPGLYRNNLDNKLILSFNLTDAYEALFSWEQKFAFTGGYPEDYGVVEIWTGSEWKALFITQGSSGGDWQTIQLDITDYAMNDEFTQIRFRMISNATTVGEGWQVRGFSIEGKVDNQGPTSWASLEPEQPQCNGWYNTDVLVKISASDNIDVDYIKYRIDGGSWLTYTGPISIGIDGQHIIDYYAVDTVGNEGAHDSVSFKIDKTAPTGSITTPQAGYIYFFGRELMPRILVKDKALIIGGLTATATASDAMSGVYYVTFSTGAGSVEDALSPYAYNLPFYLFKADTLTVTVTDNACNTANAGSVDFFKIL